MLKVAVEARGYGVSYHPVEVGEFRFTLSWTKRYATDPGAEAEPYTARLKVERDYPGEGWGFHSSVKEYGPDAATACQYAINSLWWKVDAAKRMAALDSIRH